MIDQKCRLCLRECKAERENGQMGFCGMTGKGIRAARAALHFWEEPCISGKGGSGAVFFAGCTLRCVYCQNREIAAGRMGEEISLSRLVDIFFELKEQGAENINLVTPSHYADKIMSAIRMAKERGFDLPFVYNCSGYEKVEILKQLTGLIDIYLTDFKYMSPESALRYSHAKDYPKAAKAALAEMMRQQPQTIYDEHGMMKRGVLVRHLLLPSHRKEAEQVVPFMLKQPEHAFWWKTTEEESRQKRFRRSRRLFIWWISPDPARRAEPASEWLSVRRSSPCIRGN